VPALPPYIIEPIFEQFRALLPEHETDHPLGCHRRRIPDRVVFEKLVQVLVFGCAYERIADGSCSESTLRRRRDEWIELGVMERLREISLDAYERLVGLELADLAVDGGASPRPLAAGRRRVEARWTEANGASSARRWWTREVSLWGPSPPRPTATTRRCWRRPSIPWSRSESCRKGRGCIWTAPTTRGRYPPEAGGSLPARRDLPEGQAGPA
jgi:transposase